MLNRLVAWLLLLCVIDPGSAWGQQSAAGESDLRYCLIRPEEPASDEIYADFNGRRFYFCCESCRQDFLSDPSRFDSLIDPDPETAAAATWNAEADPYRYTFWGRIGRSILSVEMAARWVSATLHLSDPISAALASAALGWMLLLGWRLRSAHRQRTALRPSPIVAALASLLFVPCFYADALRRSLHETRREYVSSESDRLKAQADHQETLDRDALHYATFFNYGNPPIPRPSKLLPSLSKTYYRGNDERSDEMFNGGNYRTVTFELWIEDSQSQPIDTGSRIVEENGAAIPLFLAVRFIRSPDTSSGYFTDKYMQRMYLTMQTGDFLGRDQPVSDRVPWTMTEHEQEWMARFPMPDGILVEKRKTNDVYPTLVRTVDPQRPGDRNGIVYLCEDRFDRGRMIGGRFHYAVRYDLRAKDGMVQPGSDLWMQATYRGGNFANLQIEDDEWLSSEPIPEN